MGGEGGEGVKFFGFPLYVNWFEDPPRAEYIQWKRTVLDRGGGGVLPPSTGPCSKIIKRQVLTQ